VFFFGVVVFFFFFFLFFFLFFLVLVWGGGGGGGLGAGLPGVFFWCFFLVLSPRWPRLPLLDLYLHSPMRPGGSPGFSATLYPDRARLCAVLVLQ